MTNKVLYPELSYTIVGLIFQVWNMLGPGYQEKHYQKALEVILREKNIKFTAQAPYRLAINEKTIGRFFMDFIIEDRIVLEIKRTNKFSQADFRQVVGYLKATNLKLGILATFGPNGVKFQRILNLY